ncbi:hypothetical protein [Moritella viscosa]|nr:hypothetical protein [Moritella viscosa]
MLVGTGRGYAEFVVGTLSFGATPMKMKARFVVECELYQDGKVIRKMIQEFYEERNISVLSDTQKYKKRRQRK